MWVAVRQLRLRHQRPGPLPGLGVRGRIGVMTGEVVSGTLERLATGEGKQPLRQSGGTVHRGSGRRHVLAHIASTGREPPLDHLQAAADCLE